MTFWSNLCAVCARNQQRQLHSVLESVIAVSSRFSVVVALTTIGLLVPCDCKLGI